MVVLVCGGRSYGRASNQKSREEALREENALFSDLDIWHAEHRITRMVTGGATGADRLAYRWAIQNHVERAVYPAQWSVHGCAAGPIRNQMMLNEEEVEFAFVYPGGRGTRDMLDRLTKKQIPLVLRH